MEVGDGGDGRPPPEGRWVSLDGVHYQFKKDREMKSPVQLEILREAFSVDPRPSAEVRAELAVRTGLPVEKVSMWFATARFNDRQCPPANQPPPAKQPPSVNQPRRQGRPPLPPRDNGTTVAAASTSRDGSGPGFLGGGVVSGPFPASISIFRPDEVMPIRFCETARPIQPFMRPLIPLERPMMPVQSQMPQLMEPHLPQLLRPQPPLPHLSVPQLPLPQLTLPQSPLMQLSMPQPSLTQLTMPQPPLPQLSVPQLPLPQLTMPQSPLMQQSMPQPSLTQLTTPQPPLLQLALPQPPLPQLSVAQLPLPQLTMPQSPLMQLSMPQSSLTQLTMPQPLLLQLTIAQSPPPQLPMPRPQLLQPSQHSTSHEETPKFTMKFDPLPHGAFGMPIAMVGDFKMFEGQDAKSIKASTFLPNMGTSFMPSSSTKRNLSAGGITEFHHQTSQRALQEYQFLPVKPSLQTETYQRIKESHFFDSSVGTLHTRVSSVPLGGQSLHGTEQMASSYSFQGQMSNSILQSQESDQQIFNYVSEDNNVPQKNSKDTAKDAHCGINPAVRPGNQFLSSDWRIFCDNHASRMERIRKGKFIRHEGERIEEEVGTHKKLIVEEIGKHDHIGETEDQIRSKLVAYYCEREKEARGLMPEKQQGEERFQLNVLREKLMLNESFGAEKMQQKELQEAARLKAADGNVRYQQVANAYTDFSEGDYTCLIEDERLELMKLAASSKGLCSLSLLDSDTLQRLDLFEDMISTFPPTSLPLKRPFSVQPWTDSEENIGNLLMVWKFLVTFADVLGLWPFTLDELVQSLHDYDSRLLGEVHVALLKYIIKDIVHVTDSPVCALGTNRISVANPEGVQRQIVEGACKWGFDTLNWQRHLNFLTWPEILRQVALSIGFGPQLKKINVGNTYSSKGGEGNNVRDVISSLHDGAAAEKAVASMQEKGLSRLSRSRHRITPGTLKFAAFYVLSLEGGEGLRLAEIVNKIQEYGLRDLTTNKSPEASIAGTLSRDAKLFERVGPSTYCVRRPFRKDPADADVVLSAARKRIQLFKSGLSESKRAERNTEEADDAEVFECDGADDPVAYTCTEAKLKGKLSCSEKLINAKASSAVNDEKGERLCDSVGVSLQGNADDEDANINEMNFGEPWVQGLAEGEYSELSVVERLNALVALIGVATEGQSLRHVLEERSEAAYCLKKQMWAEAKLEKRRLREEYITKPHHSSLIGSKPEAIQANAAKEGSQNPLPYTDYRNSDGNPSFINSGSCFDPANRDNVNTTSTERNLLRQEFFPYPGTVPLQGHESAVEMWRSELKSYIIHKAEEIHAYRFLPLGEDRRHNRYWQFSTSASPNDPGSGRIFFESKDGFWRLIDSEEAFNALLGVLDPQGIRESHLHMMLKKIEKTFKEAIRRKKNCIDSVDSAAHFIGTDTTEMIVSPDCSKATESLTSALCDHTSDAVELSASFRIELGRNELEKRLSLKRYQGFVRWMWRACFNAHVLSAMKYGTKRCSAMLETCDFCYQSYFAEEKHCPSCHVTFKSSHKGYVSFPEHLAHCEEKRKLEPEWKIQDSDSSVPISIRLLKAQLVLIEVSIPAEALQPFWTEGHRKSLGAKLRSSSSAEELLQISTLLERAIKQDLLSPDFVTTSELLSSTRGFEVHDIASGSVRVLPWVPSTTAAVAFRLLVLDASIPYILHQNLSHEEKEVEEFMVLPRSAAIEHIQHIDTTETQHSVDYQTERKSFDPGNSRRGVRARGNRGRGRGRGGRRHRGGRSSTGTEFEEETDRKGENQLRNRRRPGRPRGSGRGRGLHLSTPQKRPQIDMVPIEEDAALGHFNDVGSSAKQAIDEEFPSTSRQAEGVVEETGMARVEDNGTHIIGSGSVEVPASGDGYVDLETDSATGYNGSKSKAVVVVVDVDSEEGGDGDGNDLNGDGKEDRCGLVVMDISDDDK